MPIDQLKKAKKSANVFQYVEGKKDSTILSPEDLAQVLARRTEANTEMLMWKNILDQAHTYATPNNNSWRNSTLQNSTISTVFPGQDYGAPVYDLALPIAHRRLLSKMLVGMIPKAQQWMRFEPGDDFLEGTPEYQQVAALADILSEQFFKILDRSNFYLAASEAMSDCLISTGFMTINEGTRENPFRFASVSDSQVMVEGDPMGGISAIFRDWLDVKVGQIHSIWKDANKPKEKKDSDVVTIFECSYIDWSAKEDERYCYALISTGDEVLYFTRSKSWPWVYFRMMVLPGEVRGRGPSLEATPTAATINRAMHDELMAAAFQANPMYMAASDSAFNTATFVARPGSVVPVQMQMGEWPIAPFPQAGNVQFTAIVIADLRQQINELLYTDPLGPITGPTITATEANIRWTENLESFSAMVPRLQAEFFDPVIKRCMFLMRKLRPEIFEGMDQKILERIVSIDGDIIGLRYETPLMTARGEVNLRRFMTYMQAMATAAGPEAALASLNMVQIPEFVRESVGLDAKLIKPMEQVAQEIKAVEDQAALELEQANTLTDEQIVNNA